MNETKQEASLPVQGRIDIRTLANMVEYWETNGTQINSMSQLLSWSIELLQHLLSTNDMLPSVCESITDANNYLMEKRLYQPGMRKKGHAKLFNAMNFESLRGRGTDPSGYVKHQHSVLHNPHSVKVPEYSEPISNKPAVITDDMWERAQIRIKEEEAKEKAEKVLDTSEIVPQIMSAGLDQELYNKLMAEPVMESKVVKKSDVLRKKTEEEIETMETEFEKEERVELEKLRNM